MAYKKKFQFTAKVWLWPGGQGAWHFAGIPKDISETLRKSFGSQARGWGSFPVSVQIGETIWKTSIFPDRRSGIYILPIKASVRKQEAIFSGDEITITMTICL